MMRDMDEDVPNAEGDEAHDSAREPAEPRRRRRRSALEPTEPATPRRIGDVGGGARTPSGGEGERSLRTARSTGRERPSERARAKETSKVAPRARGGLGRRPAPTAPDDEPAELPARAAVTALEQHGRKDGRYVVRLEGVPSATVSAEIVDRLGLGVGRVLARAQLEALRDAAGALQTYDRALNLLAFRARSAADLRRRLVQKGEPAAYADRAIERLTELGLLNDSDYARQVARGKLLGAGASKRRLQQELFRRGVARSTADEAIADVLEDEAVDEDATVERLARRKLRALEKLDAPTRRRRLYGFLARRGYDSQVIRRAMARVLSADDADAVSDDGGEIED